MADETDLLRVTLALKTDLVTPAHVAACSAALAGNPSAAMIDLLVEKGYLSQADRDALEVLADSLRKAHGGDAGQTLLGLHLDERARQTLLGLPLDEDDKGTVLSMKAPGATLLKVDGASSVVASIRETFAVEADVDLAPSAKSQTPDPKSQIHTPSQKTLGKHHLLGEIARGGMGAIMEARDPDLRREVAVKVMLPRSSANPDVVARFVEEAQVQGQLEHPNVCPVHEISQGPDGMPFFLMKRVRGTSLSDVIEEYHSGEDWSLTRLIEIFLKVCDAMGFAHSRGVIHRDLKPANVMVGDYGEVLVMDWGLAKIKGRKDSREKSLTVRTDRSEGEDDAVRTLDGDVIGTPAYMPPEQADGDVGRMNETSDIYSLGAILYEILAGAPPFSGTPYNILFKVMKGEVVPPSGRSAQEKPSKRLPSGRGRKKPEAEEAAATSRSVPRELEAVALKAMAKEQEDRYPTVKALRDDILAWTEGRTLGAVEYTALERAAKWVMRNRALSALLGVAALAVLAVGAVLWWSSAAQRIAARVGKETGARVAREEQARAARAVIEKDMEEAGKYLAVCEAAFRKAAAPQKVPMAVVPPRQSVAYCYAVEKGPLTGKTPPFNENSPEPDWSKGPAPPLPVDVPVRTLGIRRLREATDAGSLAVVFADAARARAAAERFSDLEETCVSLQASCRVASARALSASGDHARAAKVLETIPAGTPGRPEALDYARGRCPLHVVTRPPGAKARLLFLPPESAHTEGGAVREGTTPLAWEDVPAGAYMLRLDLDGHAPVGFQLRLDRDLPPEGAHELAVLAARMEAFSGILRAEQERLSGAAPALRRVHVDLVPSARIPDGFVVVPAGSFLMGEDPQPVYLDSYYAARTELSAIEWNAFLRDCGRRKRARVGLASDEQVADGVWNLVTRAPNAEDLPCPTLSWDDARALLRMGNVECRETEDFLFVLPTEALWEKAARGVDGRIYPWGDVYDGTKVNGADLRPLGNDSTTYTSNLDPVDVDRGTSVYGLKHAAGNLFEWCLNVAHENPLWRIAKSGGYGSNASDLRLAATGYRHPEDRVSHTGFRVFAVPAGR